VLRGGERALWLLNLRTSWKSTLLLGPVLTYDLLMKLRLVVEHDSETNRWAAFFPELPGCASAGDTEDEAIQNAKEALELWFEPAPVDLPPGAKVLEVALT
jgi:predicted RNase H-like HicB family nuclease